MEELIKIAENIRDEKIRNVVLDILKTPVLTFTNAKPLIDIYTSPAAPRKHHFFTGGLILHTLSVVKIALQLSRIYREHYGIQLDEDLVIAVALLHDIYKYYQYAVDEVNGGYKARDDWYLSHDYAVVAELSRRNAPDKLIRAITEVHGLVPFSTLEGLIVHLADSVDARFGEFLQNVLINRIRDIEKTSCPPFKALDIAIRGYGIKNIVDIGFTRPDQFRELLGKICAENMDKKSP
ncbi:MAG: HD domain-containing protein [Desulfurococcaceae archaeon]